MLHVTPELDESFATVTAKACVPPPLSDAVVGLTLTLMEGGVEDGVDPPPQPAKKAHEINPQKTTQIPERTEAFRDIGLTSGLLSDIVVNPKVVGQTMSITPWRLLHARAFAILPFFPKAYGFALVSL